MIAIVVPKLYSYSLSTARKMVDYGVKLGAIVETHTFETYILLSIIWISPKYHMDIMLKI